MPLYLTPKWNRVEKLQHALAAADELIAMAAEEMATRRVTLEREIKASRDELAGGLNEEAPFKKVRSEAFDLSALFSG